MTSDFWTVSGEILTSNSWIIFSNLIPGLSPGYPHSSKTRTILPIWILDNLPEQFFWSESWTIQRVYAVSLSAPDAYIYRSLYLQTFKRILFSFSTLADCCEIQRTWDFKQFLIWIMCKCWRGIWKSTLNRSSHLSGISVISVRLITYHRPHLSFEIHSEISI